MTASSHAAQIIVSINCTDCFLGEIIIFDFFILHALDHCRLESSFDVVAELLALACAQISVRLALSLLEVVCSGSQDLSWHVCLLDDPL